MIPLIDNIESVNTFQTDMAGKTVDWLGEDNPERFSQMLQDPIKGKILRDNNWPDRRVTYRFNSHGFRGNEFDSASDHFCVFGDSVTFGTALEEEYTYGCLIEKQTGLKCFNLGHAGGSDSTSIRLAMTFLPKFQPEFVVFQRTFDHRFEWIEQNNRGTIYGVQPHGGGSVPTTRDNLYLNWLDIDLNRHIHAAKNLMTIRYICQTMNVPLIEVSIEDFFGPIEESARDLLHPGEKSHARQFEQIMEMINV